MSVNAAPTRLGALAEQGAEVLDAIVAEVAEQTRASVDDEGWATPQVTHVLQAVV